MAVDERSRHDLYQRLEAVLGGAEADTLMAHLPPAGWADVATKQDVASLEARMDARFAAVEQGIGSVEQNLGQRIEAAKNEMLAAFRGGLNTAITSQTRAMIFATVGSVTASTSMIFAVTRLGG